MLGQLYDADGNWPKARERLQTLMTVAKDSPLFPSYLAYFARALLRRGQADQAQVWLGKLEQLQPQAPATIEIKARVLAAEGKGAAAELVTAYSKDKDSQVAPLARLLEELGQVDAAESLYRRFAAAPGHPENALTLAAFLARHRRLPEALDLCEQAWATCPPATVGNATLIVLFASAPDPAQLRRVEGWLAGALRKNPDALPLQFSLANLMILEERYKDAEAIYRRMHERDQGSGAPLNNLAWLIAVRDEAAKTGEALSYINQAVELEGPKPGLLDTRALVHLAMGHGPEAVKDLEDALAVAPTATMYMHLAQARLMGGDRAAAAEALQAAKAAGLRAESLHPLEQTVYARLSGELARK
jgi:tetratricopeptide (TPR) repeat protein